MNAQTIIELLAVATGIVFGILIMILRHFGPKSWILSCFLFTSAVASGILAMSGDHSVLTPDRTLVLSFSAIVIAATSGYFFIKTFHEVDRVKNINRRALFGFILWFITAALVILMLLNKPVILDLPEVERSISLGIVGYLSALLTLFVSILTLASIEQLLRHMDETLRWALKFLLIGIAFSYAVIIYIVSKILLYPPKSALISEDSLLLYPVIFLVSCCLIGISWRRSTGHSKLVVSHGMIYSSITLLSVGVYLILSSLVARWASGLGYWGIPAEAFFFLIAVLFLAVMLLGTGFRHKVRNWIRRYLLAGSYDYRKFWLEATERVQSMVDPQVAAEALADIVHRALGAIDITIWVRLWNPNRLKLLSIFGSLSNIQESESQQVMEEIFQLSGPVSKVELLQLQGMGSTIRFMENTQSTLLVPLISSNRLVGAMTVGPDRSGQSYQWEAREFLSVIGGHAAGEFHKSDLLTTLVAAKEKEAFNTFSTFVLHDLKNFASTLSLIAKNAVKFQNNPEFQKDSFDSIYETAEKMKRLCNSLRSFSDNTGTNCRKPEDLNIIIRTAVDKQNIGMSGQVHLELTDLPQVVLDKDAISSVLQNLLLNAQQAITSDGTIWVRTTVHDGVVELSVTDNGKGMSKEFLKQELFLPFHTTKSDGLGIGLFQTKRIIEAHNGRIRVESEAGKGTTVIIEFNLTTD
jgi:putative PEP-CTERM system histidine kinase